jgi:hypothetical protein
MLSGGARIGPFRFLEVSISLHSRETFASSSTNGGSWYSTADRRARECLSAVPTRADVTEVRFSQPRNPLDAAHQVVEAGGSLRAVQELAVDPLAADDPALDRRLD